MINQLIGTYHRADHFDSKNPKFQKLSLKLRTKPVYEMETLISVIIVMFTSQVTVQIILTSNQFYFSDAVLPNLYSKIDENAPNILGRILAKVDPKIRIMTPENRP